MSETPRNEPEGPDEDDPQVVLQQIKENLEYEYHRLTNLIRQSTTDGGQQRCLQMAANKLVSTRLWLRHAPSTFPRQSPTRETSRERPKGEDDEPADS